jgi:hypothetical protein
VRPFIPTFGSQELRPTCGSAQLLCFSAHTLCELDRVAEVIFR